MGKITGAMTLNEYQQAAQDTAIYPHEYKVIYPALGLNGEAGECADKVKKIVRDTVILKDKDGAICLTEEQRESLALEIGDVLWYCAALAHDIGLTLDDVAKKNVYKLISRKQRNKLGGSGDYR